MFLLKRTDQPFFVYEVNYDWKNMVKDNVKI